MFECVTYRLPKTHALRVSANTNPRSAWQQVQHMFATLTAGPTLVGTVDLLVECSSEWLEADIAERCIADARALFGTEHKASATFMYWYLDCAQVDAAVEFALSDVRWTRQHSGPISLLFGYHFNWRDLTTVLPRPLSVMPDGTNSLHLLFTQRRLWATPIFIFPAAFDSERFQTLIAALAAVIPFTLRQSNLRRLLIYSTTNDVELVRFGKRTKRIPALNRTRREEL